MFRRISLAYVALAFAGVALLSMVTPEPAPVHLAELGDHVGEEVAVEALVVGAEGDGATLWQDGWTVQAYGRADLRPGDVVALRGRVVEGRTVYIQVFRADVLRTLERVEPSLAADGRWVACKGSLAGPDGGWAIGLGPMFVPVVFHVEVSPIEGIDIGAVGVWHAGAVHVYDRDCLSCDRFMDAPWAVPSNVSFQGLVEQEPWGSSIPVVTIDGSIRVIAPDHGAHMGDIVEVAGAVEYDRSSCRFRVRGDVRVLEAHGPFHVAAGALAEEPWRYENAMIVLTGNITVGTDGAAILSDGIEIPLLGNGTAGYGEATGRLVLDGLRYAIDTGEPVGS
ncbi:MAG: hypothetical protein L0Z54_03860 [Thermoplasmata archaeon]|nr:hypothetical protein [Thermoplasmata archaeon]